MQRIVSSQKNNKILKLTLLTTLILSSSPIAFAHSKHHCKEGCMTHEATYKGEVPMPAPVNMFERNWYVGGNIGVSRTHDNASPGSGNSVTQIGPGWTADLGYQFVQFYRATLAAELGYTQYHNSNETTPGTVVASTEHFATYLAAVVSYPVIYNFGIVGKLGVAYSYAQKIFTGSGGSASANAYSPYYGVGISYNMTSKAALLLQWARARGNGGTGSTDLTSLGLMYNFL